MKIWKRSMGLALSAALLAGALTGCTTGGNKGDSATPAPTASAAEDEAPLVSTEDVVKKLMGISGDTPMFTVDGEEVTAEQLFYWIGVAAENGGGLDTIDWTAQTDGKSKADQILESGKQAAQLYRVIETEVNKAGITLSDEDASSLRSQVSLTISQYGEEEYARLLQQMAISDAGLRHLMEVNALHGPLQDSLFGEQGKTAPVSEDIIALAEEEGLMLAKHILIKTVDDEGNPLSEEEQAAAKTKAEGLLAQLKAVTGEEQLKLFDQLMNENSEDGRNADGTLGAPDGYLFGTGEMVAEFEDGTLALEYGQISDLIKTDYGYHIILRLAPDNAEMREGWASLKMQELAETWMKDAKVVDLPEMSKVDVRSFCEKLTDYRASLEPAPTETPAPTATTVPSPSGNE